MGAGRWTWPPGETLRARLAMCEALGRASVNSDAANQRSPNDVDPFHKIPEHKERRTQEGERNRRRQSRRKVTSPAANAKKPTRSVELKAERVAAAKTPLKSDEPKFARLPSRSACSPC